MNSHDGYTMRAGRRAAAGLLAALGASLAAPPAGADALWESPTWGLTAALEAGYGYDSNLVARRENHSASYLAAAPSLRLARRGSLTRLEMTGTLEGTTYLTGDVRDALDPSVHILLAHPWNDGDEAERQLDARWSRRDVTDTDLGRRVRAEEFRLGADAIVYDTGRTRFGAGLSAHAISYQSADLNANEALLLEGDVGYAVTPDAHVGLGYAHEWGRSRAGAGLADIHRSQDQFMVRARGRLMPKVTGTVHAGWTVIDYRGGFERAEDTWIAGASLGWQVSAGTEATVRARRYADFAPQGESVMRTGVEVEVTRSLARGWSIRAGGGATTVERSAPSVLSEAVSYTALAGIGYQLTERFSADLSHRYTRQYAEQAAFDYTRHQLEGRIAIWF